MSGKTSGWVYDYSPFTGATFQVHAAIGDSANDQYGYDIWMRISTLAAKARVSEASAHRAITQLLGDPAEGKPAFIEELYVGRTSVTDPKARRFRMLMPDVPLVWAPEVSHPERVALSPRQSALSPRASSSVTVSEPEVTQGRTQVDPKGNGEPQRLAHLLADSIAERGCKRPTVTKAWVTEMDRLIRIDGRSPERVERAIIWLATGTDQVAGFWRANIRSPAKLRQKYDQIREQRTADRESRTATATTRSPTRTVVRADGQTAAA